MKDLGLPKFGVPLSEYSPQQDACAGIASPVCLALWESELWWLPLGMTADERVCSGAHYAAFFFDVLRLLEHPEELETPPEKVRFEQGVEYHVPKIKKN